MPVLTLVYARSHGLVGQIIRRADLTGRRWSHCGIVTPEGTVLEARAFKGVVETPWADFEKRYPGLGQRAYKDIHCPNPEKGIEWARSQLGKGYDYLGFLGAGFGRESWQEDDRWICSEYLEFAVVMAGRRRFLDSPVVIKPNLSFMVI